MEEYLQYMRTLRSQINDVEDQTAKVSVAEQTLITSIQSIQNDLHFAKSQTKQLREDTDKMIKAKGQIFSQILEKQNRIASLESDISTLTQTLELIQQERGVLSAKLVDKRAYYAKVANDINSQLIQQQEWVNSNKTNGEVEDSNLGDEARENLMAELETAKAKLARIEKMKSKLLAENRKVEQSIEQIKCSAREIKLEQLAVDIKTLEEEYKALLTDKAEEFEFMQSLQDKIEELKGISHVIKCACGMEYKVMMDICT